ncbi:MAG: hypothetical protein OEY59_13835, partial [Deltaproteobacteria bacterium]|nr:hypothetical protein [Deltaproteobacteria bacterium]
MISSHHTFGLRQTTRNILFNGISFIFSVLIGFWYTPFLLSRLGSELFGFIPLANSVTSYFT